MPITNIKQLRESLADNYHSMKSGKMSIKTGKELANTAGKMINTVKCELEYQQLMGRKEMIDFLEGSDKEKWAK